MKPISHGQRPAQRVPTPTGSPRLGGVADGLLHRYLRWCYELAELSMVLCSEPIAWAAVVVPNRADC
jgi:hypothetical protein